MIRAMEKKIFDEGSEVLCWLVRGMFYGPVVGVRKALSY